MSWWSFLSRHVRPGALAALSVLFVGTSGCVLVKANRLLSQEHPTLLSGADEAVIPFEIQGGTLVVEVELAGANRRFIVDTGALTLLDDELAAELNLETAFEVSAKGTGGGSDVLPVVQLPHLALGSAAVDQSLALVMDVDAFEEILGFQVDGLIGSNTLQHFRVTFDFEAAQMILETGAAPAGGMPEGVEPIPFSQRLMHALAPALEIELPGVGAVPAIVDTGSGGHLSVPRDAVDGLTAHPQVRWLESVGGMGGGGFQWETEGQLLSLPWVRIEGQEVGPIIAQSHATSTALLGLAFLSNYRVIIDYPNGQLWLEARPGRGLADRDYTIGISALRGEDGLLKVMGVWEGGPAYEAGLRPGDEILEMNGAPAGAGSTAILRGLMADEEVQAISLKVREPRGEIQEVVLGKVWLP